MSAAATYVQGADLADLDITWQDSTGTDIDMSTGYTFELKIGTPGDEADITKTDGITGTTTGLSVAWSTTGELNTLPVGVYTLQLTATRTADDKQRIQHLTLRIKSAIS